MPTVGTGLYDMLVGPAVCGILVTQASGEGYVQVLGKGEDGKVDTAPDKPDEYILVIVKKGQMCGANGKSTYNIITRKYRD